MVVDEWKAVVDRRKVVSGLRYRAPSVKAGLIVTRLLHSIQQILLLVKFFLHLAKWSKNIAKMHIYFASRMKKNLLNRWLSTAVVLMAVWTVQAQKTSDMIGEYYLRGVTEVASGFKLNDDATFQFFFSYGALDRFGTGHWQLKEGKLILNSRPQPAHDFALVTSKAMPGKQTTIRIIEDNTVLLPYVHAKISSGNSIITADKKGMIQLPQKGVNSITLMFEFCPERYSVFSIADTTHNYFEFRFEPWFMEVFFSNFSLNVDKEGLLGRHPLIEGAQFRYNK